MQLFTVYEAHGHDRGLTMVSTADREGLMPTAEGTDTSMGSWLLGSQGGGGTRVQLSGLVCFSISLLCSLSLAVSNCWGTIISVTAGLDDFIWGAVFLDS